MVGWHAPVFLARQWSAQAQPQPQPCGLAREGYGNGIPGWGEACGDGRSAVGSCAAKVVCRWSMLRGAVSSCTGAAVARGYRVRAVGAQYDICCESEQSLLGGGGG